jgi:hypothetical protein
VFKEFKEPPKVQLDQLDHKEYKVKQEAQLDQLDPMDRVGLLDIGE